MNLDPLALAAPPWLHLWSAAVGEVTDALAAWERSGRGKRVARVIRGRKATTVAGLFDECAAALQFPDAFGENWDALADCLRDLRRFGKAAVVICVTESDRMLSSAPSDAAQTFAELLHVVLRETNAPAKPRKPQPLHVIFHSPPDRLESMVRQWANAGLELAARP
jgi:hypothetical protein